MSTKRKKNFTDQFQLQVQKLEEFQRTWQIITAIFMIENYRFRGKYVALSTKFNIAFVSNSKQKLVLSKK